MESWHFFEDGRHAPAWNMACDEWLLTRVQILGQPIVRTYGWDRPSITIGYFQPYPQNHAASHTIIRRPTGGAMVVHDRDLTFTVVLPPKHPWVLERADARYEQIHERIRRIFEKRGQGSSLVGQGAAPSGRADGTDQCFAKHSRYDVVVRGAKVAGGAQRVTRQGLLHQGSIQGETMGKVSPDELRSAWESFGARFNSLSQGVDHAAIDDLAETKYATSSWNHRI